jgi:hypothetical protein
MLGCKRLFFAQPSPQRIISFDSLFSPIQPMYVNSLFQKYILNIIKINSFNILPFKIYYKKDVNNVFFFIFLYIFPYLIFSVFLLFLSFDFSLKSRTEIHLIERYLSCIIFCSNILFKVYIK